MFRRLCYVYEDNTYNTCKCMLDRHYIVHTILSQRIILYTRVNNIFVLKIYIHNNSIV